MSKEQINNRKDVLAKVTGTALYTGDISMPNLAYVHIIQSTISNGKIKSINSKKAMAYPGVITVITAKDIPGVIALPNERPVLCSDRVRYRGDGIALVVADSLEAAREAGELIEVSYEEYPALFDAKKALLKDAPLVHKDGNLLLNYETKNGDVKSALASADHVITRNYTTPRVQHTCIETEAAIASYDKMNETTTVICPVNSPFVVRKTVAETLGCPYTDVRLQLATIGGSFGGKNYDVAMASSRAAVASFITGRPCKLILTREQSINEGTKRHPVFAEYTVGFDNDGTLKGEKIRILLDVGAYKSKSFPVTSRMAIEAAGPYKVPAVDTIATSVYTNNVYSDALRGFGSPQVDFCSESLMDEIAKYLNMDPLEVRRINMLREGDISAFGQKMKDVTLPECLEEMEKEADISKRKKEIAEFNAKSTQYKKGLGFALLHRGESFGAAGQGVDAASGMVCIQQDGSVLISSAISEVGQGSQSTLVNLVHEMLGVSRKRISIGRVDTQYVPDGGPTVATRGTVFLGNAIADACNKLIDKLTRYARNHLGDCAVKFDREYIIDVENEDNKVSFNQVAADAFAASDHLNELGFFSAPRLDYDKSCGVGEAYMSYVYGAACAQVTVDTKTGYVKADDYIAVHDVGHAFDIEEVKGQIIGGVSMGVGYALMEEVEMKDGQIQNLNLESYLIPTALDMPNVTPVVLQVPGSKGPLGAKGLGEPATCIVAPAIINAIDNACGKRIRHLPANLEQVLLGEKLRK